jgi:crotonobetainyl-CoA:carnitine CoA-transferase CaiB-like acyl-CoA transferase
VTHPQFAAYNRNKCSITLDFKSDGGREILERLAGEVDVLIENFRPGTLDRLGLGYEHMRELNPQLVYCSITGAGRVGPDRDRPYYDATAQAMSGLWSLFTDLADPQTIGPALSDQITGLHTTQAITAGLVARERSGEGQWIEISMLEACISFLSEPMANFLVDEEIATPQSRPRRSQSYAFLASDGKPLAVHLSVPQKFWEGLLAATERSELEDDPRFIGRRERIANYDHLLNELKPTFATRPRAEWLKRLEANDVPAAPINTVAEAVSSRQAQALEIASSFGEGDGAMTLVRSPATYSKTPALARAAAPGLGEHTDAIVQGLGYTEEEVQQLRARGAI